MVQICGDEDYFSPPSDDDFQDYARVIGLLPNLFRNESFPVKNAPYALVSVKTSANFHSSINFYCLLDR